MTCQSVFYYVLPPCSMAGNKTILGEIVINLIIGLVLERSEYAYVAEQGILKAGAAFLPFVTSYPDERINFCLADANAAADYFRCFATGKEL